MTVAKRPVIGVLCCNETLGRPVQTVATRFVAPLARFSDSTVMLVPAVRDAVDIAVLTSLLDGVLLTGSRSNVAPERYGGAALPEGQHIDRERDEVALALAGRLIEAGKPVFGIFYFFYIIIIKRGFRDGISGLIYYFIQGFCYRFLVDILILFYKLKKFKP